MKKIRIRRSTADKLVELFFRWMLAIVLGVFVGVLVGAVAGAMCGQVAAGVSGFIIYCIIWHIEIVEDGEGRAGERE